MLTDQAAVHVVACLSEDWRFAIHKRSLGPAQGVATVPSCMHDRLSWLER